jgi:hypothetical protein
MCDECGTVFSENAEGVSKGIMIDPETGQQRALDYCDICSEIKERVRKGLGFMRRPANSPSELMTGKEVNDE